MGAEERLEKAKCYTMISTDHTERDNLTSRHMSLRPVREGQPFDKEMRALEYQMTLDDFVAFLEGAQLVEDHASNDEPDRGKKETPKKRVQDSSDSRRHD